MQLTTRFARWESWIDRENLMHAVSCLQNSVLRVIGFAFSSCLFACSLVGDSAMAKDNLSPGKGKVLLKFWIGVSSEGSQTLILFNG